MLYLCSYTFPHTTETISRHTSSGSQTGKIVLRNLYVTAISQKSSFLHCLAKSNLRSNPFCLTFFYVNSTKIINCWCIRICIIGWVCRICFIIINHLSKITGGCSHNRVQSAITQLDFERFSPNIILFCLYLYRLETSY